jgi:hypothetical protein
MSQISNLLTKEEYQKLFPEENVLVSCEVKKYNDYGFRQD